MHGGLRYLANGQVGVAHESAVERGILMEITAPHLDPRAADAAAARRPSPAAARPRSPGPGSGPATCSGVAARTARETLPRPRRISAHRDASPRPGARRRGAARRDPVVGRPARGRRPAGRRRSPARPRPRRRRCTPAPRAVELDRQRRDAPRRAAPARRTTSARARSVNATGVWAGDLVDDVRLRPSRGTHLVLRGEALPGLRGRADAARARRARNRFVFVLPQPDGTGLRRPHRRGGRGRPARRAASRSDAEIEFLLATVSIGLARPLTRADVVGTFAGCGPLLEADGTHLRPVPPARGAHLARRAWSPWSAAS